MGDKSGRNVTSVLLWKQFLRPNGGSYNGHEKKQRWWVLVKVKDCLISGKAETAINFIRISQNTGNKS